MDDPPASPPADAYAYARFAGSCAILAGLSGFLYTAFFAAFARGRAGAAKPSAFLLMTTGLFAIPVAVGVYERLRQTDAGFALLGLALGLLGATGSFVHGGYDLAILLKPGDGAPISANQVDPRRAPDLRRHRTRAVRLRPPHPDGRQLPHRRWRGSPSSWASCWSSSTWAGSSCSTPTGSW